MLTKQLFTKHVQAKLYLASYFNKNHSTVILCHFFVGVCFTLFQTKLIASSWFVFGVIVLSCVAYIYQKYRALMMCFLVFLLGAGWANYSFDSHKQRVLPADLELKNLAMVGVIKGVPNKRDGNISFILRVEASGQSQIPNGGLLKLNCYRCSLDFKPEQKWKLTVRLKRPNGYASWGAFDYEKYLFRHQIIAKGYVRLNEEYELLSSSKSSISQIRYRISNTLQGIDNLSESGLAIMSALMIGDKSFINQSQSETFQKTGVSHLMAISGLHIGLVFLASIWVFNLLSYPFARIFLFLPRQYLVLLPALFCAFFYAALAGFAISTIRALVMLSVFVFCKFFARQVSLHKVLLVAACLILLIDPFSILDIGFWLSCAAVWIIGLASGGQQQISLIRLQPLLWVGMMPMTAFFFGQISLVSPIVNLIIVPLFCLLLIPLTLVSLCFLLIGFDGFAVTLISALDHVYSVIYLILVKISSFDLIATSTQQWKAWQSMLMVGALTVYMLRLKLFAYVLWSVMLAGLFMPIDKVFSFSKNSTELNITLLDVGQGLSLVVEVSGQKKYTLVYDTGPRYPSGFTAAKAVLIPYLNWKGVSHIDQLVISHADNDHIGGYSELQDAFLVEHVLTSRTDVLPESKACTTGQKWQVEGVGFEFLSPMVNTPQGSNNLSCVLKISYAQTNILITGDIEKQVERHLLSNYHENLSKLKAEILLVPHQGSKTSSTQAFIDTVEPELALVAAGYLNHYGHPHPMVVQRYIDRKIDLLSTVDNGSVIIKVNSAGWRTLSFRKDQKRVWRN